MRDNYNEVIQDVHQKLINFTHMVIQNPDSESLMAPIKELLNETEKGREKPY